MGKKVQISSRLKSAFRAIIKREKKLSLKLRPEVLLSGNVPKPMHGVAPRVVLGKKWWDETRKAAYQSTGRHCVACGVHESNAPYRRWLEGHELYEVDYLLGRMTYLETVPLCHACHCFIHDGRLLSLLEKGEISRAKYDTIIAHGEAVLRKAGLQRQGYDGPFAEWSDWRLVVNGEEYPPKFKSLEDWIEHFDHAE